MGVGEGVEEVEEVEEGEVVEAVKVLYLGAAEASINVAISNQRIKRINSVRNNSVRNNSMEAVEGEGESRSSGLVHTQIRIKVESNI